VADRFTGSKRAAVSTAIQSLTSVSQFHKDATMLAFDDMRLAEILLRTTLGDITTAHDIANVAYVGYLIGQERAQLENRQQPSAMGDTIAGE
jgi:hypothetical protein